MVENIKLIPTMISEKTESKLNSSASYGRTPTRKLSDDNILRRIDEHSDDSKEDRRR